MRLSYFYVFLKCYALTVTEPFTSTSFTPAKGSYSGSQVETSTISGQWLLSDQTLLATSDTGCTGACPRLKWITGGNPYVATKFTITGITSLSVKHRSYNTDAASTWVFEKSTDQVTWTTYGASHTTSLTAVTVTDTVTLSGAYYVRLRITSNLNGVRMVIDDFKWVTGSGSICGNGVIESGETCDDSNVINGDGCSSTCAIESGFTCSGTPSVCNGICGDGLKRGTETCDDANTTNGDGCNSICSIESGFTCSGTPSTCLAICGDGLTKGPEACDDANTINGDGCSSVCAIESGFTCSGTPSVCVSASIVIENFSSTTPAKGSYTGAQTETTSSGQWNFSDQTLLATTDGSCNSDLICPRLKTNGFVATLFGISSIQSLSVRHQTFGTDSTASWKFQTSPDGITWSDYGTIHTSSTAAAIATDNVNVAGPVRIRVLMVSGSNRMNIDDFKWTTGAPVPSVCGDGIINGSETCDDSNTVSGDGCSSVCSIESGYTCSGTPSVCTLIPVVCGDGIINGSETCDDNGTVNGDGCSSVCTIEPGWACNDQPSFCNPIHSNGIITGSEQCDDNNTVDTDGCSNAGVIKKGYKCTGTPSVCTLVSTPGCGNGILEAGEACDDGNSVGSDGCSATCTIETGYTCAANSDGLNACNLIVNNPTPPFTGYLTGYLPQPFVNPSITCSSSTSSLVCGSAEPVSGTYSSCCQSGGSYPLIVMAQQWIPGYCAAGTCNANVRPAWSTAGGNFFTLHGIWPDTCAGGQGPAAGCDGRVTGCVAGSPCPKMANYLDQYPDLKADMHTYWPTASNNANEYFWAHEWDKHGTCHDSFKSSCSLGTCPSTSWVNTCTDKYDYFSHALNMRKTFDLYNWFSNAGIIPRTEAAGTYTLAQFVNAISAETGKTALIQCTLVASKYYLTEIHLFFLADQRFHNIPASPIGSGNCPSTGIIYLPYP